MCSSVKCTADRSGQPGDVRVTECLLLTQSRYGGNLQDGGMRSYSALMLAPRITFPHFSVSSTTNLLNSSDAIALGSTPKARSRALKVESARPELISLLSLPTISAGVFLGAPIPNHAVAS